MDSTNARMGTVQTPSGGLIRRHWSISPFACLGIYPASREPTPACGPALPHLPAGNWTKGEAIMETAPESGNVSQGTPRTPRASGQFRDGKALQSPPRQLAQRAGVLDQGGTYLAQIDVSLRAVGRETLTRLGNSRATAAVTLFLLLLYSAPQARTKVPSPILCLSVGHHLVLTACLLSPCWVSARVSSHFPVPHPPSPPAAQAWLGTQMYPTFAWLSWSGRAYRPI